ncbi:hypothetical protein CYMTET_30843, partial [Cymbomonas tetramitiformis]
AAEHASEPLAAEHASEPLAAEHASEPFAAEHASELFAPVVVPREDPDLTSAVEAPHNAAARSAGDSSPPQDILPHTASETGCAADLSPRGILPGAELAELEPAPHDPGEQDSERARLGEGSAPAGVPPSPPANGLLAWASREDLGSSEMASGLAYGCCFARYLAPHMLSPLQLAVAARRPSTARALLEAGASHSDPGGWLSPMSMALGSVLFAAPHLPSSTPGSRAAPSAAERKRGVACMRALLKSGARVDSDGYSKWPPAEKRKLETPLEALAVAEALPSTLREMLHGMLVDAGIHALDDESNSNLFDLD